MTLSFFASAFLGALQLAVPSYGLRLNRRFGSREVGWALVGAFAGLALLNLAGGMGPVGALRDWELARGVACAAIPVLLLIGLAHLETLLRERARLKRKQRLRLSELEQFLDQRNEELSEAKEEFHQTLSRKDQDHRALATKSHQERLALGLHVAARAGQHLNRHVAVIELYTRLLLAQESDPARFAHYERLVAGAIAARELGRQLLACSGRLPVRPELVSLGELVAAQESALRSLLGEHQLLECGCEADSPLVRADPRMVRWMLEELVRNARDAMPNGGRVNITVECSTLNQTQPGLDRGATNQFACVCVADTGHGAGREFQTRLGEPFFTTKTGRHAGLGLASVSGLMRTHGGELEVMSAPGHGTTVRLFFPVAAACAAPLGFKS
jgi:signal transduction histidine kinase